MDKLEAISPVDGRYRRHTGLLADIFSEKALMKYRVMVEAEYLIALSEHPETDLREFSDEEKNLVRDLYRYFFLEDAHLIKTIETKDHGIKEINNGKKTNHDVKAVEYFMKYKLKDTSLADILEWIHFGLTSYDINNIAYALMLRDGVEQALLPDLEELYYKIRELAIQYKDLPMLARTHGQPASPTTFGKEFNVFASRLKRQIDQLKNFELLAKLNGATGNYNAHHAAYPDIDWIEFSRSFIERFNAGDYSEYNIKLKPDLVTTQIEPYDNYIELFDILKRINTILTDFTQDMWRYISDEWIVQKPVEGEVGSSTMAHKINPIDFENGEGNLAMANGLFETFARKLPVSRLQRDLSGSTVERNFGTAFGHCHIAYKSILRGLNKIHINEKKVVEELEKHPEVLSEAYQTILRREGVEMPYEKLKELTRGKQVTMDELVRFIDGLGVPEKVKEELRRLSPTNYIGLASKLAELDE